MDAKKEAHFDEAQFEREEQAREVAFNKNKAEVRRRLAVSLPDPYDDEVDASDSIYESIEGLDLSDPVDLEAAGAAICEHLEFCDNVEYLSIYSAIFSALAWAAHFQTMSASVAWVEETYGEEAANKFCEAMNDDYLGLSKRGEGTW
jgi:hypothetical protein